MCIYIIYILYTQIHRVVKFRYRQTDREQQYIKTEKQNLNYHKTTRLEIILFFLLQQKRIMKIIVGISFTTSIRIHISRYKYTHLLFFVSKFVLSIFWYDVHMCCFLCINYFQHTILVLNCFFFGYSSFLEDGLVCFFFFRMNH